MNRDGGSKGTTSGYGHSKGFCRVLIVAGQLWTRPNVSIAVATDAHIELNAAQTSVGRSIASRWLKTLEVSLGYTRDDAKLEKRWNKSPIRLKQIYKKVQVMLPCSLKLL